MTKTFDGSARYGASSDPNCFSTEGFVLPTRIGISGGKKPGVNCWESIL